MFNRLETPKSTYKWDCPLFESNHLDEFIIEPIIETLFNNKLSMKRNPTTGPRSKLSLSYY